MKWDDLTAKQQKGRSSWWPEGYRNTFITIWHEDPETDGTDDSCGYSFSKVNKPEHTKIAEEMADWDFKHPFYFAPHRNMVYNPAYDYKQLGPADTALLCYGAMSEVSYKLDGKGLSDEMFRYCMDLGSNSLDNLCSSFVYHDAEHERYPGSWREQRISTFRNIIRLYISKQRPWYEHPKWHFKHWSVQVVPLQSFKRWAFSKCAKCKKGFSYGYSPIGTWDGEGPSWFGTEKVWHSECDESQKVDPILRAMD